MTHNIEEQLNALSRNDQLNPDRVWVEKYRTSLLGQIAATTQVKEKKDSLFIRTFRSIDVFFSALLPQKVIGAVRPVMTLLAVLGLTAGGWAATVSASYNSIPGDRLYQVKLATENVQKAVATIVSSDEQTIKNDINRAKRRAEEIKQAVQSVQDDPTRKTKVNKVIKEVAVKELEESVRSAEEKLQSIAAENGETAGELAKQVSQQTEVIKEVLQDVTADSREKARSEDASGEQEGNRDMDEEETITALVDAAKRISDISISALETAVEKRTDDDGALLKEAMQRKVVRLSEDAKETLEAAEQLLATSTADVINVDATTTTADTDETDDVSTTSTLVYEEDVEVIADRLENINLLVEEAEILIESNKFSEAIASVRVLHDAVSDMQQAVKDLHKKTVGSTEDSEQNSEDDPSEASVDVVSTSTTGTVVDGELDVQETVSSTATPSGAEDRDQ